MDEQLLKPKESWTQDVKIILRSGCTHLKWAPENSRGSIAHEIFYHETSSVFHNLASHWSLDHACGERAYGRSLNKLCDCRQLRCAVALLFPRTPKHQPMLTVRYNQHTQDLSSHEQLRISSLSGRMSIICPSSRGGNATRT